MNEYKKLSVNEKGHLVLGGCDAVELAKTFGTPLYVMEEQVIRQVCQGYMKALRQSSLNGIILFASKAFLTTAMCRIIDSEGLGLDVVSGGELYTALQAGFPPEKIYMHGNNKTNAELKMALDAQIGRIVLDSFEEIEIVNRLAAERGRNIPVSLRVKPGVEAHTHEYIKTGNMDSKFGFGISDGEAGKAVQAILACNNLSLIGLHCHIGSQIFEIKAFEDAVDIMTDFAKEIDRNMQYRIAEINFGGGYGIHYVKEDKPLPPGEYVQTIIHAMERNIEEKSLWKMDIAMEPGRSIVGEAGTTLYEVGTIKQVPGIRKYVSVDGGMTDNIRPALYQAQYSAVVANKMDKPNDELVSIAGSRCESGDMLIKDITLPAMERGDILAVLSTGAYGYSMASNYNKVPLGAVVLVKDGKAQLMVKRQMYDQLIENDVIPDWL